MEKEGYLTIGEMSEICNVSTRRLRHYDQLGLVCPVRNEETGYRYYAKEQVQFVLLIKDLQKLGFSLADIGQMMEIPNIEQLCAKIQEHIDVVKVEIKERLRRLEQETELLVKIVDVYDQKKERTARGHGQTEFQIETRPARTVLSLRYSGLSADNDRYAIRRAEIYKLIEDYDIHTVGHHFTYFHEGYEAIFHKTLYGEARILDYEAGIGALRVNAGCPNLHQVESCRYVSAIHFGSYNSLLFVYQSIYAWAEEQGIALKDESLEEYLIGPTLTRHEEQFVTKVYIPIKED